MNTQFINSVERRRRAMQTNIKAQSLNDCNDCVIERISGQLIGSDGEPLSFATLVEKGDKLIYTVADENGRFTMEVKTSAVLEISHVSMPTPYNIKASQIGASGGKIKIENMNNLSETVVVWDRKKKGTYAQPQKYVTREPSNNSDAEFYKNLVMYAGGAFGLGIVAGFVFRLMSKKENPKKK